MDKLQQNNVHSNVITFVTGFLDEYGLWPDFAEFGKIRGESLTDLGFVYDDEDDELIDFDDYDDDDYID